MTDSNFPWPKRIRALLAVVTMLVVIAVVMRWNKYVSAKNETGLAGTSEVVKQLENENGESVGKIQLKDPSR